LKCGGDAEEIVGMETSTRLPFDADIDENNDIRVAISHSLVDLSRPAVAEHKIDDLTLALDMQAAEYEVPDPDPVAEYNSGDDEPGVARCCSWQSYRDRV